MIRALIVTLLVALASWFGCRAESRIDRARPSLRENALDLLLWTNDPPCRIEIQVEIEGKSAPQKWDEAFTALFSYHDRNSDGSLDEEEARRLPSAFQLRSILWGRAAPWTENALAFAAMDLDSNQKISEKELFDVYRRSGLGSVLVGVGKSSLTDRLTTELVKQLDRDGNGTVTAVELSKAAELLPRLDQNDDELISPGELLPRVAYPGAIGSILLTAPAPGDRADSILEKLPLITLPLRTEDLHWSTVVKSRRNQAKLREIPTRDLLELCKKHPAKTWLVSLDKNERISLREMGESKAVQREFSFRRGDLSIVFRRSEGKLLGQLETNQRRWRSLFAPRDLNSNDLLEPEEIASLRAGTFQDLLRIGDRNGDRSLSISELSEWLAVQEQLVRAFVLITIVDLGNGLFELIDENHDGALSLRELRTALSRLKEARCIVEGKFEQAKLPRQLVAFVSRGQSRLPLGQIERRGPEWFQAMDRNGDGDVSAREFTGSRELFNRLDQDKDGLLRASEAARGEQR